MPHLFGRVQKLTNQLGGTWKSYPMPLPFYIMCLYPRFMRNKRYIPTEKNKGRPELCTDPRKAWVPVGCGNCIECRKQKSRAWQVRLHEEYKCNKYSYFVTYSFSPEALQKLTTKYKKENCNEIATIAVRLYLERWRKKYKKSQKHWFVTELGHQNTERIHIHGIIFSDTPIETEELEKMWSYGNIWVGDYCSERTINYIIKYITKIDEDHKLYKSITLCSPGLGKGYMDTYNAKQNKYRPRETREYYLLNDGSKVNLPIYYRNHLYTESERARLWTERLDKQEIWVQGIKVDLKREGEKRYYDLLKTKQAENKALGYGSSDWKLKDYAVTFSMLQTSDCDTKDRLTVDDKSSVYAVASWDEIPF